MWRTILALCVFLLYSPPAAFEEPIRPVFSSTPSAAFAVYLPLAHKATRLEIIETASGEDIGYPTYYYLYGYVLNRTAEPLYQVVVDLEVTIWAYDDPPPPPYTETVHLIPAFAASLPGQANPFYYDLWLGKASASFGPILGYSASSWVGGDRHSPLTIVSYQIEGTTLSGTARNDSPQALHDIRVVVFDPTKCPWMATVVDKLTLQPGEETGFHIDHYSGCVSEDLQVLGQGAYHP